MDDLDMHAIVELWLVAYWKRELKQERNDVDQERRDHSHIDRPLVPF